MLLSPLTVLVGAILSASSVAAHGVINKVTADGVSYMGYDPNIRFKAAKEQPDTVGWVIPKDVNYGFVSPKNVGTEDIICHVDAKPGKIYAKIKAGGKLTFHWGKWIRGHNGPVISYLGNCNGDCQTVKKSEIKWTKIQAEGLIKPNPRPGLWATEQVFANNMDSFATIPASIAPGKYVIRHEFIALHVAYDLYGAQLYPQCINLEITGSGTDSLPGGTVGQKLYKADDPGIAIDLFNSGKQVMDYPMPGPPLYSGATGSGGDKNTGDKTGGNDNDKMTSNQPSTNATSSAAATATSGTAAGNKGLGGSGGSTGGSGGSTGGSGGSTGDSGGSTGGSGGSTGDSGGSTGGSGGSTGGSGGSTGDSGGSTGGSGGSTGDSGGSTGGSGGSSGGSGGSSGGSGGSTGGSGGSTGGSGGSTGDSGGSTGGSGGSSGDNSSKGKEGSTSKPLPDGATFQDVIGWAKILGEGCDKTKLVPRSFVA